MTDNSVDLNDWENTTIDEPVFTKLVSTENIQDIIEQKEFETAVIPVIPRHTQAMERNKGFCCRNWPSKKRTLIHLQQTKSRIAMPQYNAKREYIKH